MMDTSRLSDEERQWWETCQEGSPLCITLRRLAEERQKWPAEMAKVTALGDECTPQEVGDFIANLTNVAMEGLSYGAEQKQRAEAAEQALAECREALAHANDALASIVGADEWPRDKILPVLKRLSTPQGAGGEGMKCQKCLSEDIYTRWHKDEYECHAWEKVSMKRNDSNVVSSWGFSGGLIVLPAPGPKPYSDNRACESAPPAQAQNEKNEPNR